MAKGLPGWKAISASSMEGTRFALDQYHVPLANRKCDNGRSIPGEEISSSWLAPFIPIVSLLLFRSGEFCMRQREAKHALISTKPADVRRSFTERTA